MSDDIKTTTEAPPPAPEKTEKSEKKEALTPAEKRKFQLKINGSVREIDEDGVLALAQKGWASDEKFMQAAQERKKVEAILSAAKNDPSELLRLIGVEDPAEFYKSQLEEYVREHMMDPKDRELNQLKKKLAEHEKTEKQRMEREQQERLKKASDHWAQEYDKQISEAISGSGLPKTEQTVAYAAEIMLRGLDAGVDLPMNVVMEMVKEKYVSDYRSVVGKLKDDELYDMLGDELVKKVQSADVRRRKSKDPEEKGRSAPVQQPDNTEDERITFDDLRERVEKWKRS